MLLNDHVGVVRIEHAGDLSHGKVQVGAFFARLFSVACVGGGCVVLRLVAGVCGGFLAAASQRHGKKHTQRQE